MLRINCVFLHCTLKWSGSTMPATSFVSLKKLLNMLLVVQQDHALVLETGAALCLPESLCLLGICPRSLSSRNVQFGVALQWG